MALQIDFFERLAHKYIFWLDEKWTYTFTNLHPYFGMITVTLVFLLYFNQDNIKYFVAVGIFIVASFITGYATIIQNQGAIPYQAMELLTNHRLYATLLVMAFIIMVFAKFLSKLHAKLSDLSKINNFLYAGIMLLAILLIYTGKEMVFRYAVGVITG